jgi:hypothetical protein
MAAMLATPITHSHVDTAALEFSADVGALVLVRQKICSFVAGRNRQALFLKFSFVSAAAEPTRIPRCQWRSRGAIVADETMEEKGQTVEPPPPRDAIRIRSATYGATCGAPVGNAIAATNQSCSGKESCAFRVDVNVLGDPAPRCGKDFQVGYSCERLHCFEPALSAKSVA